MIVLIVLKIIATDNLAENLFSLQQEETKQRSEIENQFKKEKKQLINTFTQIACNKIAQKHNIKTSNNHSKITFIANKLLIGVDLLFSKHFSKDKSLTEIKNHIKILNHLHQLNKKTNNIIEQLKKLKAKLLSNNQDAQLYFLYSFQPIFYSKMKTNPKINVTNEIIKLIQIAQIEYFETNFNFLKKVEY